MDPFENLPDEILCQTVGNINQLSDIVSHLSVSRRFQAVASDCITSIQHNELIYLPIDFIIQFRRLQLTNNIVITLSADQIDLLENLPFLRKAYFKINGLSDQVNQFIQLLAVLNIYSKVDNQDWKIAFGDDVIFIKNNRYIVWANNVQQYEQIITPLLNRMIIWGNLRYDQVRLFLQEAYPELLEINPSIITLIENGGIDNRTLDDLIYIYVYHHKLGAFDETMSYYFEPLVEIYNQTTDQPFDINDIIGDNWIILVENILKSHEPPQTYEFPYLTVPEVNISRETYKNISNGINYILESLYEENGF